MTFSQVCDANIASSADEVIKCIYLRRRYEVHGDTGAEYDLLSSLLHLREAPSRRGNNGTLEYLSVDEVAIATASIQEIIDGFDYATVFSQLKDRNVLKTKFEKPMSATRKSSFSALRRNWILVGLPVIQRSRSSSMRPTT